MMTYCPHCASALVRVLIDEEERLACSRGGCGYVFYDNPVPVVAAIVELDGKVVLGRKAGWPPEMFGIVAGFLERGETPEQAVLREVEEEVGLKGSIREFVGSYSFFEANQLILAYHVQAEGTVQVGPELEAVKFVHPDELKPWPVGTGPAVKDWLEKRSRAAQGT